MGRAHNSAPALRARKHITSPAACESRAQSESAPASSTTYGQRTSKTAWS